MKKLLFSFVMMLALVIVAGTAMAQSSTTPYQGAKYTYTVNGVDAGGTTRLVKIYYTTNAAPTTKITCGGTTSISVTNVNCTPASTPAVSLVADDETFILPASTTAFTFDATFGATVATNPARIWVVIYNDALGTQCSNTMYLGVTPKADALDYKILAAAANVCPTPEVPTSAGQDGIADNTVVTYTITRTGGVTAYNWSFDFDGSTVQVTGATDTKVVTTTVPNTPGAVQTVTRGISNFKQYVGTSSVVNSTSDTNSGNNSAVTTIDKAPSIGTFTGN